jgi:hypothetical protein
VAQKTIKVPITSGREMNFMGCEDDYFETDNKGYLLPRPFASEVAARARQGHRAPPLIPLSGGLR